MVKQKTIKQEITLNGTGLHTGCTVTLRLKPADEDTGIIFIRTDLPGSPAIKADIHNVLTENAIPRCTSIGDGEACIHTVEHLMSVLCGLGITNIYIETDDREIPGLDGSGIEFLKALKKAGVKEQSKEADYIAVREPICVAHNGASITISPAKEFRVSYTLDYPINDLRSQFVDFKIDEKTYEKEIAPCRTFCLDSEAKELQNHGLGKGADYTNTLVVGEKGVIDNKVRFSDEFARHKVLDCIGDLYLLGIPILGHVHAVKSGHRLNLWLLKKILEQKKRYAPTEMTVPVYDGKGKREIDINGIMKILPHRYPFLLVDRVIEVERGKKALGIKNVTINDNFFQGHFPSKPVMPGVLMVEAMAQVAGVVVLTNESHRGKLAFFMAINNAKFRRVVEPGDQMIMEVEVLRDRASTAQIRGVSKVAGEVVAEADMMFSFTDSSYLVT